MIVKKRFKWLWLVLSLQDVGKVVNPIICRRVHFQAVEASNERRTWAKHGSKHHQEMEDESHDGDKS